MSWLPAAGSSSAVLQTNYNGKVHSPAATQARFFRRTRKTVNGTGSFSVTFNNAGTQRSR